MIRLLHVDNGNSNEGGVCVPFEFSVLVTSDCPVVFRGNKNLSFCPLLV